MRVRVSAHNLGIARCRLSKRGRARRQQLQPRVVQRKHIARARREREGRAANREVQPSNQTGEGARRDHALQARAHAKRSHDGERE